MTNDGSIDHTIEISLVFLTAFGLGIVFGWCGSCRKIDHSAVHKKNDDNAWPPDVVDQEAQDMYQTYMQNAGMSALEEQRVSPEFAQQLLLQRQQQQQQQHNGQQAPFLQQPVTRAHPSPNSTSPALSQSPPSHSQYSSSVPVRGNPATMARALPLTALPTSQQTRQTLSISSQLRQGARGSSIKR